MTPARSNDYRPQSDFLLRRSAVRLHIRRSNPFNVSKALRKYMAREWIEAVQWMDERQLRIICGAPKRPEAECPPRAA